MPVRRKTRRGGKPPRATREGNPVLVDMYILLARTPTRESLTQVADEVEELTEPEDKLDDYRDMVSGIRAAVASPRIDVNYTVQFAKGFMSDRLLSDEDKEFIQSQGVEVDMRNRWQAGRRRKTRKPRKSRKM